MANLKKAYFAGGCFWGVEYYFQREPGVKQTKVGFMGGTTDSPSYKDVTSGSTGHAETIEVSFDPAETNYETLAKLFFEIHDPSQVNRQGPDVGEQYRSEVFYLNDDQKKIAEKLIGILKDKGIEVATKVSKAGPFTEAEEYHQKYYEKKGGTPYCHVRKKVF